jgi:hypothetical protein
MTAATVFGLACAERDIGAHYRHGRLASAESFDRLHLTLPADGVPVDLGHDHEPIGRMTFGELDTSGRLRAVAVIDDADWLLGYDGDVFLSPEMLVVGEGVRSRSVSIADVAGLVSLGLTTNPATLAASPLTIVPGDMRRRPDRWRWPMSWRTAHPLLARAVDRLPPATLDAERHRARAIDRERVVTRLAPGFYVDQDGEPIPTSSRSEGQLDADGRPRGSLWVRPCGRILSVR